jgi:hypothetical protein
MDIIEFGGSAAASCKAARICRLAQKQLVCIVFSVGISCANLDAVLARVRRKPTFGSVPSNSLQSSVQVWKKGEKLLLGKCEISKDNSDACS